MNSREASDLAGPERWKVIHGDCLTALPGIGAVDAVVTDPPYSRVTHDGARTGGDGEEVLLDFDSIDVDTLRRILESVNVKRWVVATMDFRHVAAFMDAPPAGLRFVRFGAWIKPNGSPQFTGDRPGQGWEAVAILHRDGERMRWNGGGRTAVWTFPKINGVHRAQKPIELVRSFVSLFTEPNEIVLDPFAGSGTTGVACMEKGRRFIGIEREASYCEIARRRIADAAAQGNLFTEPAA